ncbi:MAG: CopG family transcriptional regulator [Chloroflexi bacterium]|nr:CopG family transcriptional regulator [Chloroflexota bacterium]MYD66041.1 CopG family transcriptional regulator [Chloroflexota bacterium]
MGVDKISVSFDAALGDEVRRAARRDEQGLSAWLAGAARAKLRAEALRAFLDAWKQEHGPFTAEEMRRARAELGLTERAPTP